MKSGSENEPDVRDKSVGDMQKREDDHGLCTESDEKQEVLESRGYWREGLCARSRSIEELRPGAWRWRRRSGDEDEWNYHNSRGRCSLMNI